MSPFTSLIAFKHRNVIDLMRSGRKPNFIFLDEPTGNLDEENAVIIQKLLFDISRKYNIALITATHDSNFIRNFDKIYKKDLIDKNK